MFPHAGCELNFRTPYELLVATMLAAQCTDKRVNIVTEQLFLVANTPEKMAEINPEKLEKLIFSCGFYREKAKNLIKCAKSLLELYNGVVPDTIEQLQKLAGVGRKTASVVVAIAFGKPAMPVDTHVFRVARRLGLSKSNTPLGVERDLRAVFCEKDLPDIHNQLIFFGRYHCKAMRPNCADCELIGVCGE